MSSLGWFLLACWGLPGSLPMGRTKCTGQERRRTAYLSGDVRHRLSLQGCLKKWEGSRPMKRGQTSPLFLLDIQALIDSHGLTTPRKRAVL